MNKTRFAFLSAVIVSCTFFFSLCRADVLFVAPDGDDSNPGTESEPFRTIEKAQQAVRALRSAEAEEPVTVLLRGGTYRITKPPVFGPADGGDEKCAVTYAAYKSEKPVISGGRVISGWKERPDGTWSTTIPDVRNGTWRFRSLFVNGRRAVRCREPDSGFFRVKKAGKDKRTSFAFYEGDLKAYRDLDDVELVFIHDWSISRVPVASIDEKAGVLTVKHKIGGASSWSRMDWFEQHPRYYLENAASFLDAEGEWFLDTETGTLFYKPLKGETIASSTFVAPVASQLISVQGDPGGKPVRNLHFAHITCRHTRWSPPDGVYWGRQACTYWTLKTSKLKRRHEPADPAAVQFDLAEDCCFYDGEISHIGASGVWIGRSCRNCRVVESVIHDVGGNGIMIGEGQVRIVEGGPWWETAPGQAASNNTVSRNVVTSCGKLLFGAVGIWTGLADSTTIESNEVKQHPYTGVSIGWMWWNPRSRPSPRPTPCRKTVVRNNHIHHVMQVLSDGGGIYSLGVQPDSVLSGNVIHDIPRNAGRAESNGMFLDQGTGDFVIENNVIYNVQRSPLRFHKGWKNVVRNNILEVPKGVPVVRYNDTQKERIVLKENRLFEKMPAKIIEESLKNVGGK